MKFIDKAKIYVKSGAGGNGKISFRHEKFVPNGGPDGGDGGKGGSIIFYVDPNKETLIDFSRKIHYKAKNGQDGGSSNCYGKNAENLVIHIPLGTQIYSDDMSLMYFDAVKKDTFFTLFEGGKGGQGNLKFVSSTNRAPKQRTEGEPSQESWIRLILKLFCDYGLVGLPNAGKSTLLKMLTGSSTKIGDYPFTTLKPELGALWNEDDKIILADLPGIIQGASKNKGLGYDFLGHIERCRGIIHIIDVSLGNSLELLDLMLHEIKEFSEALLTKKQIVVLNKIDLVSQECVDQAVLSIKSKYDFSVIPISAINKIGINQILK
ncbi:GTPase ObgE [Alphaproteobacteria bacterium endosymbiont of Tiliacea citrago]|uniref:GTPase ObgE n=1 Tax=Alphaproteobacteria bacterium endosymbiont of Tiliacea citrago TaxID=3077944 RepID=UPI00313C65DF